MPFNLDLISSEISLVHDDTVSYEYVWPCSLSCSTVWIMSFTFMGLNLSIKVRARFESTEHVRQTGGLTSYRMMAAGHRLLPSCRRLTLCRAQAPYALRCVVVCFVALLTPRVPRTETFVVHSAFSGMDGQSTGLLGPVAEKQAKQRPSCRTRLSVQ